MAKSIRSKWRRKCRAVKRERYGKKELDRLKKTLGISDNGTNTDVKMEDLSDVAIITDAKSLTTSNHTETVEDMDTDKKRIFNRKTLKDQHGTYPVWLHPRKIKKHKKAKKEKSKKKK